MTAQSHYGCSEYQVYHLRELGGLGGRILGLSGCQNGCWHRILSNEIAVGELDLPGNTTLDGLATAPGRFDAIIR